MELLYKACHQEVHRESDDDDADGDDYTSDTV